MASAQTPGEARAWQAELRAQFPIVTAHPDLAYLDSAATSQKPRAVLEAVETYLTTSNANAGRGTYPWANRTTELVERTRARVKEFLGDTRSPHSTVHFTSGTTEGLRMIARDWLVPRLRDGDEILVPFADHRANLDPWLEAARLSAERGAEVRVRALPRRSPPATTTTAPWPHSSAPAPGSSRRPTSTTSSAAT